jgi:hypothetical protein
MKDMMAQAEKLRVDATECKLISQLATTPEKRALFARLAEHLGALASEVDLAIAQTRIASEAEANSESGEPAVPRASDSEEPSQRPQDLIACAIWRPRSCPSRDQRSVSLSVSSCTPICARVAVVRYDEPVIYKLCAQ